MQNNKLIKSDIMHVDMIIIDRSIDSKVKLPSSAFMRKNQGPAILITHHKLEDILNEDAVRAIRAVNDDKD